MQLFLFSNKLWRLPCSAPPWYLHRNQYWILRALVGRHALRFALCIAPEVRTVRTSAAGIEVPAGAPLLVEVR